MSLNSLRSITTHEHVNRSATVFDMYRRSSRAKTDCLLWIGARFELIFISNNFYLNCATTFCSGWVPSQYRSCPSRNSICTDPKPKPHLHVYEEMLLPIFHLFILFSRRHISLSKQEWGKPQTYQIG